MWNKTLAGKREKETGSEMENETDAQTKTNDSQMESENLLKLQ